MFRDFTKVESFLEKGIKNCRVLVLGDIMLDRYYFGEVKRISPEAPVPVALVSSEKDTLGGAANVALNLHHLGCKVKLAGLVGADDSRTRLQSIMENLGMDVSGLISDHHRPTTTKLRIIGGHQQMLRLDFEKNDPLTKIIEKRLKGYIEDSITEGIDGILISDYAKGVCTSHLCQFTIAKAAEKGIPLIADPKGYNWRKYSGAQFITPNMKELSEALSSKVANDNKTVERAGAKLRKRFNLGQLVLTRSEKGMSLITQQQIFHIPTLAQEVFDVSGAGDTVIATMGAALAGGVETIDAAMLANLAAGIVVGKVGTYAIRAQELLQAVRNKQGSDFIWQEVIN